jgi:acyl dehydratase
MASSPRDRFSVDLRALFRVEGTAADKARTEIRTHRKLTEMTTNTAWSRTVAGQPKTGDIATRSKTMSVRDIELYTQITGDRNPLHYDEQAARASVFGGLIVQGGVTSGLLNALVAEDLPGPGTVFLSMQLKFVKAVYVGDTATARVEVTDVRDDKPICTLAVKVRNQHGDVCLSGVATTYTAALKP